MQNSIRDNITKEDIIAEIRLELNADLHKQTTIIIVEGSDDITFFRGKLSDQADIKESFSGKIGVCEIVEEFQDYRVIGICDRDYDISQHHDRLFYYDYSCLEMMLISNDKVFESFCNTYYRGSNRSNEVRMQILEDIKWISVFRHLSAQNSLGINFKAIRISEAFNDANRRLDLSIIIQQLEKSNRGVADQHTLLSQITNKCHSIIELGNLLQITNGHDFINYFQRLCCSYSRRSNSKSSELFKGLVCAFRKTDFQLTDLYNKLISYQSSKKLSIV